MPLIGHDVFFDNLVGERVCHLEGRVRYGKTALAFRLAYELMMKGDLGFRYVVTNVPSVWAQPINTLVPRDNFFIDTVFVMDEGGKYLKTAKDADDLVDFCGKLNNLFLIPSRKEPYKSLRVLRVWRRFSLGIIGIPLWVFGWELKDGNVKEKGTFYWYKPSEIWGVYDSVIPAIDDQGILDFLHEAIEKRVKRMPRKFAGVGNSAYIESILEMDKDSGGLKFSEELQQAFSSVVGVGEQ